MKLEQKEKETLIRLLEKKIEGTQWVIDNKHPENEDRLADSIETMKAIIDKINNDK